MEQRWKEDDLEELYQTPVELLQKSEGEGLRYTEGYGTTAAPDHDEEEVMQKGIDYRPLRDSGFVNYDHQRRVINGAKVPIIIGEPVEVLMKPKGLFIKSLLYQGDVTFSEQMRLAEEMWQLGMAIKKSGGRRSLAYSIEGIVKERRGLKIVKSEARHVALTHKPVNPECTVEMFQKSLCCGKCSPDHPEYNPAHKCGDGNKIHRFQDGLPHLTKALEKALESSNSGPISVPRTSVLMRENLDRGLTTVLYGEQSCDCFNPETGHFHKGIAGCYHHMVDHLGYDTNDSHRLLSRIIDGAKRDDELMALAKTAGFISR